MSTSVAQRHEVPLLNQVDRVLVFLFVASVFVTTFYFRLNIHPAFAHINVLFYATWAGLAIRLRLVFSRGGILVWTLLVLLVVLVEGRSRSGTDELVRSLFLVCAPALVVLGRPSAPDTYHLAVARSILMWVNRFTGLVFVILGIDMITSSAGIRFLASVALPQILPWVSSDATGRHPSIWGHYLMTACFYLAVLFMNHAYQLATSRPVVDRRLVFLVCTVGVLSTGSKTASVILLLATLLVIAGERHRGIRIVALVLFAALLSSLGFLDLVLNRFGEADLSSGRNLGLIAALEAAGIPGLVSGYGGSYQDVLASLVGERMGSLFSEYSLLALTYRFGVVIVLLMLLLFLASPARSVVVIGSWMPFVFAVLMIGAFSAFNSLMVGPDAYLLYSLYSFIVVLSMGVSRAPSIGMR